MDLTDRGTFTPLICSVVTLAVTLCVTLVLGSVLGRADDVDAANILAPAVILVTTLVCAGTMLVGDPLAPWMPLPWFLLATGVYFGLGALMNVFGSDEVIAYAGSYFVVNRTDLLRTNTLNLTSIAVVLFSYAVVTRLLGGRPIESATMSQSALTRLMWIFAIVGIPVKFFLSLPYNMGLLHFVLPGVVGGFSGFSEFLLLALCYRCASGNKRLVPLTLAFAGITFVGDVLSFSKSSILFAGLTIILGVYLARPARKTLLFGLGVLVCVYLLSVPFVSFARVAVRGSTANGADLGDRAAVTAEYARKPGSAMLGDDDESWWSRINLSNIQAFAMTLRDAGYPGNTFETVVYALVPRVLWPNKPVITPGTEFNYLASGNDQSASSPGVFAEAYWNGGWPVVVAVCTYLGALLAWFARNSRRAMAAKDLRWLPCAFYGLLMAFPENWFISTYVSGAIVTLLYYFAMKVLVRDHLEIDSLSAPVVTVPARTSSGLS